MKHKIAGTFILFTLLIGCSSSATADNKKPISYLYVDNSFGIAVDNETGCQYITYLGSGITPRMNSEGKQICIK